MQERKYKLEWISKYRSSIYGISALWIMFFHAYHIGIDYSDKLGLAGKFIESGNMGVELFLFMSGVSLFFSFSNNPDSLIFIKKRLIKLFSVVWIIKLPYWIYLAVIGKYSIKTVFAKMTLLRFWFTNDQEIWFVSFILLCYFLYPIIYKYLFRSNNRIWLRFVILCSVAVILDFIIRADSKDYYSAVEIAITRMPIFLFGCVFGKYVFEKKTLPGLSVYIISSILIIVGFYILFYGKLSNIYRRLFYLIPAMGIIFLLPAILNVSGKVITAVFSFFGKMSLELYLSHLMWISIYKNNLLPILNPDRIPRSIIYLILLALSIISSYIVMKILECITSKKHKSNHI